MTTRFGTVLKPLCVERSQAGPLGCVHSHICYLLLLFLGRWKVVSRTPSLPLAASRVAMSRSIWTRGNGKGTRPFWVLMAEVFGPTAETNPVCCCVFCLFVFLQEVWNLSSQWDQTECTWPMYQERIQQAQEEMAAWESWSEEEGKQTPQVLAVTNTAENSSDPPRQGSEGGRSQGGGSRTGTRAQGRALPAPPCEGEAVSRKRGIKAAARRGPAVPSRLLPRSCCRVLSRGPLRNSSRVSSPV